MATAILASTGAAEDRLARHLRALVAGWQTQRRLAADHRALARAGRLGPRLLADMGLADADPRPLVGDWETLLPNGYLVRPLR